MELVFISGTYMNHTQASLCDPCPPRYYCVNKDRADPCPTGKYCIGKAFISDHVLMGINFAKVLDSKIFSRKTFTCTCISKKGLWNSISKLHVSLLFQETLALTTRCVQLVPTTRQSSWCPSRSVSSVMEGTTAMSRDCPTWPPSVPRGTIVRAGSTQRPPATTTQDLGVRW